MHHICRKYYHGLCLPVLSDRVAGITNAGGLNFRKGQDFLEPVPVGRNAEFSQEAGEPVTGFFFYQDADIFLERQSSGDFLQDSNSERSPSGATFWVLVLTAYVCQAESTDERWSYLGSLSVNIWQLSYLKIIFLIRTIGRIHQSGKKKVCIEMNTRHYSLLNLENKNNKYFK